MYKAIKEKFAIINQKQVAKRVGINEATLCRIINQKQNCSRQTAFCIVKTIHESAKIEEYFTKS